MDIKLYTIWGISYCGSTILSYILGKSPEIFSIGETHWLTREKERAICAVHKRDCDFWTKEFIDSLDKVNIYDKIKSKAYNKYKIKAILTSDKNHEKYNQIIEQGYKIDKAILMFKNPEEFTISWINHMTGRKTHNMNRERLLFHAQVTYYYGYRDSLKLLQKYNIPFIGVYLNDLINNPKRQLEYICKFLGLDYNNNLLEEIVNEKTHQIGGNQRATKNSKIIIPDEKWKRKFLTPLEKKIIRYYNQYMFPTLMNLRKEVSKKELKNLEIPK